METCAGDGGTGVLQCFMMTTKPNQCPPGTVDDVIQSFAPELCALNETVEAVFCGPFVNGNECCYVLQLWAGPRMRYVGRAFLVDEGLVKAELREGRGWERDLGAEPRRPVGRDALRD